MSQSRAEGTDVELLEGQATCPFCGDTRVRLEVFAETNQFSCRCLSCAAEGPWGKSRASAIGWWNRRLGVVPQGHEIAWRYDLPSEAGWYLASYRGRQSGRRLAAEAYFFGPSRYDGKHWRTEADDPFTQVEVYAWAPRVEPAPEPQEVEL